MKHQSKTANLPLVYSDIHFMLKCGDNNIPLQSGAALIQKYLCECDDFQFLLALYQRGVDQSIVKFLKLVLFFWGAKKKKKRKIRGSRQSIYLKEIPRSILKSELTNKTHQAMN